MNFDPKPHPSVYFIRPVTHLLRLSCPREFIVLPSPLQRRSITL